MYDMHDVTGKWEKRWHPLKQQWVVYAAHRNSRPWSGHTVNNTEKKAQSYDPHCHLCPGNTRISGKNNPDYNGVYVFDNDHPVLGSNAPIISERNHDIYLRHSAKGAARVICYHPNHGVSLAEMEEDEVVKVFVEMQAQTREFAENEEISSILIFENKGEAVGVSNPHPHCQVYATDFHLHHVDRDRKAIASYHAESGKNLFDQIISAEIADGRRIVSEKNSALAFVPFFARYAYEVMIFPRKRASTLLDLDHEELKDLSKAFHDVIRRYDRLFDMSFPYVMSISQAPIDGNAYDDYHMHIHIQPPLRQPGLIKHLAGPEIGAGNFMADTIPEEKAAELRSIQLKMK